MAGLAAGKALELPPDVDYRRLSAWLICTLI